MDALFLDCFPRRESFGLGSSLVPCNDVPAAIIYIILQVQVRPTLVCARHTGMDPWERGVKAANLFLRSTVFSSANSSNKSWTSHRCNSLPSACACAPTILKLMQTSRYPAVSFDSYAGESLFFTRSMTTLASSAIVRKQRMRSCRDLKTMLVRVRSSSLEMSFCAIVKAHFQLATSPTGREHKQTEKIVVVGETLQHTL
mmetsp:Transcript_16939/g.40689  ORF Transcript_16939/g.40689 Transcript_16939/m.40689 type:complete len:200 (+) Transcript_16939:2056-2655(+)